MKLRCVENSIRLRLKKSDVDTLAEEKNMSVSIGFPAGAILKYELRIVPNEGIAAIFDSGVISILLPENKAMHWIASEEVSIGKEIKLPDGQTLSILIEKDFPCKNRPDEDKADTFQELVPEEEKDQAC
jgi:hypothetical protein